MAEDKTFRYGFIMLGLFLLAVGMFIMTADRPQVYVTFCVIGAIMLVSGVVWSMCQCYPKIAFVPADTDFESFLSPKARGPTENGIPEKKGSQPPYSRLEEEEAPMQSPPDYHHIQMKVFGCGEDQGVLSAPSLPPSEPQAGGAEGGEGRATYSEPFIETTVVVHRGLDSTEAERPPSLPEAGSPPAPQIGAAPLASFPEDLDSSADGSGGSSRKPSPPEDAGKADPPADRYPDFALIDAPGGDEDSPVPSPGPGPGLGPNFWAGSKQAPTAPRDAASEGLPEPPEENETAPKEPEEEEEDLYYGLKDGPGGGLEEEELFDFEPDS
ncbi:barttin [Gracilinanus agilis]|uniref:barttin n=1 Tax=Gracilinanus agilis TaxID=191870 RepID=UPI001CFC6F8D|nr:barttin [Gracilinanus agilis]